MNKLKAIFIIPAVLGTLLIPFGLFIEKNLFSLLIFWFLLVPSAAVFLPKLVVKLKNHLLESLLGVLCFYGFVVFLIYDHYQSDFFQLMLISCGINLIVITAINLMKVPEVMPNRD